MTGKFTTLHIDDAVKVEAPDGSQVSILSTCVKGSMARFSLGPGLVSKAVSHRTVDELWYFTRGSGEMWRRDGTSEEIVKVSPGLSLSIPVGTYFQVRNTGTEPLEAIGVTMPPWSGMDEARFVKGK
jgi:mannose-6-phosphate isomerase-like protein (cupin superfamily)